MNYESFWNLNITDYTQMQFGSMYISIQLQHKQAIVVRILLGEEMQWLVNRDTGNAMTGQHFLIKRRAKKN